MVKGQCKIHFLPFVCCIVLLWYLTFELCSTASPQLPTPLSVYLSSVSFLYWIWNLLDFMFISAILCLRTLSPLYQFHTLTFPVSWHFSNGKELQFVFLCFPVFSTPLWPRGALLHDSLRGLFPLLTFKCANKSTDGFLQAVRVSNIHSLLSSRGMRFITLTES